MRYNRPEAGLDLELYCKKMVEIDDKMSRNCSFAPDSRIAVFQMEWALQVHTLQLVEAFSELGYGVDVYLHATDSPDILKAEALDEIAGVRVISSHLAVPYNGESSKTTSLVTHLQRGARAIERLWRPAWELTCFWLGRRGPEGFAHRGTKRRTPLVGQETYVLAVGVEGAGYIWAASALFGRCPVYYYSLELYLEKHPFYHGWRRRGFKRRELYWSGRSAGLIIQDRFRASEFLTSAGLPENHPVFYLPVSIRRRMTMKVPTLRERLQIDPGQIVVLYVGDVEAHRGCITFCEQAADFPENWTLVLHGKWGNSASERKQLEQYRGHPRIRFSEDLVPFDQLGAIIANSDVGLAFYNKSTPNNFHTGYSSEKIALYFSRGIPVVVNDYPSQMEVVSRWKCGVGITSFTELSGAVAKILREKNEFSKGASDAFQECYDFDVAKSVLKSVVKHR